MRILALAIVAAATSLAYSQTVEDVYKRDDLGPFKLAKNVQVESTVVGPIVRTSTLLTYDNPYKELTEACLNFSLPEVAALSGFAYFYGDEYVRGQLMDKEKAWFIYTAITSRDRDPGIMDQESPTSYHCQIYPLKVGTDLRIRLYTVAFLQPSGGGLQIPNLKCRNQPATTIKEQRLARSTGRCARFARPLRRRSETTTTSHCHSSPSARFRNDSKTGDITCPA